MPDKKLDVFFIFQFGHIIADKAVHYLRRVSWTNSRLKILHICNRQIKTKGVFCFRLDELFRHFEFLSAHILEIIRQLSTEKYRTVYVIKYTRRTADSLTGLKTWYVSGGILE
jgi:hypothetical protein